MGWCPPATSTIASRRCPRPTGPSIHSPAPSGPRWRRTSRMRLRRNSSTRSRGSSLTMPTIAHMCLPALDCYVVFSNHDKFFPLPEDEPRGLLLFLQAFSQDWEDDRWVCEGRSEEHTSELQSQSNLVCRLLLEKKKKKKI